MLGDSALSYVIVNATAADDNAEIITMGFFRNCRVLALTPGCDGRSFDNWGYTAGAKGFVSVTNAALSPPLDLGVKFTVGRN